MKKILLVDDIKETHKEIRDYFDGDYKILYSQDVDTAINILENNDNIFCALIDLKLDYKSEYGGIDLIEYIQKNNINIKFIIFSAYSLQEESIKNAIIKKTNISDGDYNQYTKNQVIKGHGNYLIEIEQKLKELSDLSKSSYDFGKYFSFLFAINTYEDQKIEDLEKPIIDAEKLKKIPASIGRLKNLKTLSFLSFNCRTLPKELCELGKLQLITISPYVEYRGNTWYAFASDISEPARELTNVPKELSFFIKKNNIEINVSPSIKHFFE